MNFQCIVYSIRVKPMENHTCQISFSEDKTYNRCVVILQSQEQVRELISLLEPYSVPLKKESGK